MPYTSPIFSDPALTKTADMQSNSKIKNELGKDEFLKLLLVQLKNQDPLNPMKDQEFIAQLASFSSLEQMNNLNKTMEQVMGISLIGMSVKDKVGVSGMVTDMKFDLGKTYLTLAYKGTDKNGNPIDSTKQIEYGDVKEIKNPIISTSA